jgi:hypothetical protein
VTEAFIARIQATRAYRQRGSRILLIPGKFDALLYGLPPPVVTHN